MSKQEKLFFNRHCHLLQSRQKKWAEREDFLDVEVSYEDIESPMAPEGIVVPEVLDIAFVRYTVENTAEILKKDANFKLNGPYCIVEWPCTLPKNKKKLYFDEIIQEFATKEEAFSALIKMITEHNQDSIEDMCSIVFNQTFILDILDIYEISDETLFDDGQLEELYHTYNSYDQVSSYEVFQERVQQWISDVLAILKEKIHDKSFSNEYVYKKLVLF